MTTAAAVRAAIVATLQAVPDIGRVHDHERHAVRESDFKDLYVATVGGRQQLRGWYVRRVSQAVRSPRLGRRHVTIEWLMRGFMALDDAAGSEKVFDALIDALVAAFSADQTLGGLVSATADGEAYGPQLDESQPVLFGGVLCHAARLSLTTRHIEHEEAP